jgi:GxxExxY protein
MSHDFEPLSAKIIQAAITVHKALGPGFLESIYHKALRVALTKNGTTFENKKKVRIYILGRPGRRTFSRSVGC